MINAYRRRLLRYADLIIRLRYCISNYSRGYVKATAFVSSSFLFSDKFIIFVNLSFDIQLRVQDVRFNGGHDFSNEKLNFFGLEHRLFASRL